MAKLGDWGGWHGTQTKCKLPDGTTTEVLMFAKANSELGYIVRTSGVEHYIGQDDYIGVPSVILDAMNEWYYTYVYGRSDVRSVPLRDVTGYSGLTMSEYLHSLFGEHK